MVHSCGAPTRSQVLKRSEFFVGTSSSLLGQGRRRIFCTNRGNYVGWQNQQSQIWWKFRVWVSFQHDHLTMVGLDLRSYRGAVEGGSKITPNRSRRISGSITYLAVRSLDVSQKKRVFPIQLPRHPRFLQILRTRRIGSKSVARPPKLVP